MSDDYKQMDHAKKIQHVAANRRRHLQNPVASGPQKSGMRKNMSFANAQEYKRGKLNAARKPIRQVQSMPDFRDPLRDILRSVPFYAIHGMGSHVRKLSKTFSRHSFSGTQRGKDSLFDSQISDAIQKQGYTTRLILVVFSVLMGAINFGYNTSVLNTPEAIIRQSLTSRPWVDDFSWAIIVSIFCIGGLLGSTIAPPLLDTLRRQPFPLYNGIFLTLALLFQAVSMGVMWLAVARLLIGVSCGGTLNQFAMVVGILLAQILGRPLGNDPGWRILLGIGAIFSTLQVLLSVFIVESPRWLVMQGKHGKARELLKILRGEAETSELLNMEIQSMLEVSNMERRFGLGPRLPWANNCRTLRAVERATAMGACSCINWVASFLVGLLFPAVNTALGSYTFLPFALITLVASFFSYYIVPETKGKSHKEIEAEMFGGREGSSSLDSGYSIVGGSRIVISEPYYSNNNGSSYDTTALSEEAQLGVGGSSSSANGYTTGEDMY
eukprot:jgi/Bigna1/79514/fgenesh1_pg.63_\